MLFEKCGHRGGNCPCVHCPQVMLEDCGGCLKGAPDGYAVDTDVLCADAKAYCESGREKEVSDERD